MRQLHRGSEGPASFPAPLLAANSRFGSFKKEEAHELRKPDVRGDELTRLRQRRELLRSMTPEQAMQAIEYHTGLNVFEAVALAKREGKIIVPNFVHDRILTETNNPGFFYQHYPVWTGTCVICEASDKPFGKKAMNNPGITFSCDIPYSMTFDIPVRFQGRTNCALVIEHPDFEIVKTGKDRFGNNTFELKADEENIHLLESLPRELGQHCYDETFRIPVGAKMDRDYPYRYLCRLPSNNIIFVARIFSYFHIDNGKWEIDLDANASVGCEVALF